MPTSKTKCRSWAALFFLTCLIEQVAALYNPIREYSGSHFFDRWAYYGNVDNTTFGNVSYVDQPTAIADQLTYVNAAGNAIIKVDNTTTILPAPQVYRKSVRLTSTDPYGLGSLIVIDALHIPYGCSVWPAFWTLGIEEIWPEAGEIDIIEAINDLDANQIALHTTVGCYQASVSNQSGNTGELDCSTPSGCVVQEAQPNSYGPKFALAGGGVFALLLDNTGIYSWFFSRPNIPTIIQQANASSKMDTSTWGIPTAMYPNSACAIPTYFLPQQLILVTTLCGVWAGVPSIYQSTCQTPTGSCVNDNVIGNGSNYAAAYWEIRYIRTYLAEGAVAPTPTSTSTGPGSSPTQDASSSGPTSKMASLNSSARPLQSSILPGFLFLLLISVIGL